MRNLFFFFMHSPDSYTFQADFCSLIENRQLFSPDNSHSNQYTRSNEKQPADTGTLFFSHSFSSSVFLWGVPRFHSPVSFPGFVPRISFPGFRFPVSFHGFLFPDFVPRFHSPVLFPGLVPRQWFPRSFRNRLHLTRAPVYSAIPLILRQDFSKPEPILFLIRQNSPYFQTSVTLPSCAGEMVPAFLIAAVIRSLFAPASGKV